jgi:peptidoglycan hydrolase-like protein with peptidoglycan-binding domain
LLGQLAQLGLLLHGYNPGVADGKMGDKTRDAIRAFQRNHGLPADGQLRAQLLSQITGLSGALGEPAESSEAMGTSAGGVDWKRKMWPNSIQR